MKQYKHKRNFQLDVWKLRKVLKSCCVGTSTEIPVENLKNAVTQERGSDDNVLTTKIFLKLRTY